MLSSDFPKAAGRGDRNISCRPDSTGVNVNLREEEGQGRTALMKACRHGHISIIELLLAKGARADERDAAGDTALSYAACNGHMDIVKLLLRQGQIRNCGTVREEQFLKRSVMNCSPSMN